MKCCVSSCKYNLGIRAANNITFHSFPTDAYFKQEWLKVIQREDWTPTKNAKICSLHFKDHDFFINYKELRRLKCGVMPSLNLNLQATSTIDEPPTKIPKPPVHCKRDIDKICRICLATNRKCWDIRIDELRQSYGDITERPLNGAFPLSVCWECSRRLISFAHFKNKVKRSYNLMTNLLQTHDNLTLQLLQQINRKSNNLESNLSISKNDDDHVNFYFNDTSDGNDDNAAYIVEIDEVSSLQENNMDSNIIQNENDFESYSEENDDDNNSYQFNSMSKRKREIYSDQNPFDLNKAELDKFANDLESNIEALDDSDATDIENKFDSGSVHEIYNDVDDQEMEMQLNQYSETINIDEHNTEIYLETDNAKNDSLIADSNQGSEDETNDCDVVANKSNFNKEQNQIGMIKYKGKVCRKVNPIIETIFQVMSMTYEESRAELEKRKTSDNYIYSNYKCPDCYRGFSYEDIFIRHLRKHSNVHGTFVCDICNIHCIDRRRLRKHMTGNHIRKYICKYCTYRTYNGVSAIFHVKYHKGRTYQCNQCEKVFLKQNTLLSHIRLKHSSEFICELCGHNFVSDRGLQLHKNIRHKFDVAQEVSEDAPQCETCEMRFVSREALSNHLEVHNKHASQSRTEGVTSSVRRTQTSPQCRRKPKLKPKFIQCEQCDMQFRDGRKYGKHFWRSHPGSSRTSGARRFVCEVCGKTYRSVANLRDHSYTHTGEAMFACTKCPKKFVRPAVLQYHMKIHDEVRSTFTCPVCHKEFSSPGNMRRHNFTHTGLKPFKCEICGKCFSQLATKKSHISYVHMKNPWPKRDYSNRKVKSKPMMQDNNMSENETDIEEPSQSADEGEHY